MLPTSVPEVRSESAALRTAGTGSLVTVSGKLSWSVKETSHLDVLPVVGVYQVVPGRVGADVRLGPAVDPESTGRSRRTLIGPPGAVAYVRVRLRRLLLKGSPFASRISEVSANR